MANYRELYFRMFAAVADAVDALEYGDSAAAKAILIAAQQNAEEMYLNDTGSGGTRPPSAGSGKKAT